MGDDMADRQPLNATFFAFKKRERGGVLLGASLTYAVLAFGIFGIFAWFNWQAFADYIAWSMTIAERQQGVDPNDAEAVFAAMTPPASVMSIVPSYFLLTLVFYLLFAAYEAACLRWMIRGEVKGLFGLALDADTFRVWCTYWLWLVLLIATYIVLVVVGMAVGFGAVMSAQGGENIGASVLVAVLVCLLLLFGVLYFAVRFAPAAATSIARRRFAFFDAWTVTKGRFWAMFGSFVLLFLMFIVGAFVLSIGLGLAMGMGMMGQIDPSAEPSSPAEMATLFASPSVWAPLAALYAVMIIGSFVFYVTMFGVNARAAQAALEEGKIQAAQ
jgi:hypothetical protein